jgi:hypothetical protein
VPPSFPPSANSQYSSAAHSDDSVHGLPGVTHFWNEQTSAPAQQSFPHALVFSQHSPPAQIPFSPQA